ncbi:MAG: phosphoadenosine phosphosulfate reductase [Rhodobacteraceae bacterium]|nr:phosphoadenosine phosphosulfate reductase [Paracoccaceae bacterium]
MPDHVDAGSNVLHKSAEQGAAPLAPEIDLSTALTDAEWLARLDELGDEIDEEGGAFAALGAYHAAFYDDAGDTLLVSFEQVSTIRARQPDHRPFGFSLARGQGWSSLTLIARQPRWYRDADLFAYFDAQIDDGFFDRFRRVLFYGEGMCAYAACAYSVAAPGATVLAIAPQATLAPEIAGWDTRFAASRGLDFTTRFGFAPDMLDGSRNAIVIYDAAQPLDHMHAMLFRRPFVTVLRCRGLGEDTGQALHRLGASEPLILAAGQGKLTPVLFHRLMRARRQDVAYLTRLTQRCASAGRMGLAKRVLAQLDAQISTPSQ